MSDIIPAEKIFELMHEAQKIDDRHISQVTNSIMEDLYDLASVGEEPIAHVHVNNHESADVIAKNFLQEGYRVTVQAVLSGTTIITVSLR